MENPNAACCSSVLAGKEKPGHLQVLWGLRPAQAKADGALALSTLAGERRGCGRGARPAPSPPIHAHLASFFLSLAPPRPEEPQVVLSQSLCAPWGARAAGLRAGTMVEGLAVGHG